MDGRTGTTGLLAALALLVTAGAAHARTMAVMESFPSADTVMDGRSTQVFVRFDGPVDHRDATLEILRGDQVSESLHARLESEPSVLYANAGRLAPGSYRLHWVVRSVADRDRSEGTIPFTVR